jgi:mannose-6-phosphate isomerase class I
MSPQKSMASLFVAEKHDRIAELWWGHPGVIVKDSMETIKTCFLLKLLFVEKPLSLQVHPTLEQIHTHPSCFHDPQPKPEVVIALTEFEALCGFLSGPQVQERIGAIPSLASYPAFSSLFEDVIPDVNKLLSSVREYAIQYPTLPCCRVFLSLLGSHPSDPAVLCPFYMNHVSLRKGQALIIPASQPHCYLSGQGAECMPPSDNVVRCGLTRKECDFPLFFELTRTSPLEVIVKNYPFDHPELNNYFRLYVPKTFCLCRKGSVFLVLKGEGKVDDQHTKQGDSWIVETDKTIRFSDNLHILLASPTEQ